MFAQGQYSYGAASGGTQPVTFIVTVVVACSTHWLFELCFETCWNVALQSASSYGTGYQGAASQSAQQAQTYASGNTGYSADQQGYTGAQTDYDSSQQVCFVFAYALHALDHTFDAVGSFS